MAFIYRAAVPVILACVLTSCPSNAQSPKPPSSSEQHIPAKNLLASANWNQILNGGNIVFGDGVVDLRGTGNGFPVLQTKVDPFPVSGDWTCSFGYRYTYAGNYGTEIRCECADGTALAAIHEGDEGQFLALGDKQVWHVAPNQNWHFITLSYRDGRISATVDGKSVGDMAAGNSLADIRIGGKMMPKPWDWSELEVAMVKVHIGDPNFAASRIATRPSAAPQPHEIIVSPSDKSIDCLLGDTITLKGHYADERGLQSRVLMVDDTMPVKQSVGGSDDDYSLSWRATSGQHLVGVGYVLGQGDMAHIRRVTVNVLPNPPMAFTDLPAVPVSDETITLKPAATYNPRSVSVQFNGKTLQAGNGFPLRMTLPLSALSPGRYPLTFDCYDSQGSQYISDTPYIEVPERLRVVAAPSATLETAASQPTVETATVAGVSPAFVVYQVDGKTIASSDGAKYAAHLPLSDFHSGSHSIRAVAINSEGDETDSPPVSFLLTNKPDDQSTAEAAKIAKDAADKVARQAEKSQAAQDANALVAREQQANLDAGFVPRPGMDSSIFRKQLSSLAYCDPSGPSGDVGTVNGLSVLTMDGAEVTGVPLTIDAVVRSGHGATNFLAFSTDDSRVAAEQAAECCKRLTGLMGYRWDWSKYDLTVGYRENEIKNAGPSAGLADAVAIMSAVFDKPVDRTVAMTGALNLQGRVLPVGGIVFKADAALSDSSIRTVLVPNDSNSLASISALFAVEPGVFVGKQIVFVGTLGDALRYAVIGWDTSKNALRAEEIIQRGIQLFGEGKGATALKSFNLAAQIAPENTSSGYWRIMVAAVEKANPLAPASVDMK